MFWVDLIFVWRCHDIPCAHFYFLSEPTLRKDAWIRATSATVMVIFSKVLLWKVLDHSYTQSSFSTTARYIDSSIFKDSLQLKILRTWIKIRPNFFMNTWVNIKQRSTKVSWKFSLSKKYDPALQRTLHQSRWYFTWCSTEFEFHPVLLSLYKNQ